MRISIIGAGAMGGATARGLLRSGACRNDEITISNPTTQKLEEFAAKGAHTTTDNAEAAAAGDIVMVAVKPWLVQSVLDGIKGALDYSRQTLVVIAAGISGSQLTEWTDNGNGGTPGLLLAIPNIAIAELSSMTFIVPVSANGDQTAAVRDLFNTMGSTIITEERLLAAGTTLASCGIAYAARYIRAASEGGVELGFRADEAKKIVLQTVKGTVDLLMSGGEHPEAVIDKVTTPGGVTIRGLNEMEHAGFTSAVIRGLKAGAK